MMTPSDSLVSLPTPPGPAGSFLLGSLREMGKGRHLFLMDCFRRFGDVIRFRLGPRQIYLLSHPDAIQHVLQTNYKNYNKQTKLYGLLRLLLGNGLLTSENDFWRKQRRLAQPSFHRERLEGFAQWIVADTERMLLSWKNEGKDVRDIAHEMMGLTLRIITKTMFSVEIDEETERIGDAVTEPLEFVFANAMKMVVWPLWVPTRLNRRFLKSTRALDDIIYTIIRERRAKMGEPSPRKNGDLLSMLMEARDEDTGEGMNDRQLRDEMMTIFLAGHETTANALSWTWYLLSQHPEAMQKIREELDVVLKGEKPTLRHLPSLPYVEAVIKESMRLYPPVWNIGRGVVEDDEIGGYRIPKGSFVFLSPYITHRHPAFWKEPETFLPERFLQTVTELPRFAYFPFGGGPHQCIGNNFAMMEAQLILATVAQKYSLTKSPSELVELDPLLTLRPRHGLKMTLIPR